MLPASKKLKRRIGLGLPIHPSVPACITLALGQEPLEIGSWSLVCGMSIPIVCFVSLWSLVNKIC